MKSHPSPVSATVLLSVCLAALSIVIHGLAQEEEPQDKPQEKQEAADKTKAALLGTWKMTEIHENGNKIPPPVEMVFTFEKESLEQKIAGRARESSYKIDTTKKPMQLDLAQELAGQKREFKMIFELDGDTLRICSKRANNERPSAFEAKDGASITVFKRVK